ncbi:unnamed protein product [Heterobilharzia americana]|nr:unnamed protein product [Heterobilharzia americana]
MEQVSCIIQITHNGTSVYVLRLFVIALVLLGFERLGDRIVRPRTTSLGCRESRSIHYPENKLCFKS